MPCLSGKYEAKLAGKFSLAQRPETASLALSYQPPNSISKAP